MSMKTISETLFEDYLRSQRLAFEFEKRYSRQVEIGGLYRSGRWP